MKKPPYIYLALFLFLLLSACEKQSEVTVGLLMESYSSSRWAVDKKYFEEKITELNGKVITLESDGTEATQFKQAMDLINQGVDVIVIVAVNVNSAAAIVREAHAKNIKVIAYDRMVRNSELDYFVGLDAKQIGNLQASYALNKKPKGNYILIGGDKSDINAVNIEEGQREILSDKIKSGEINILYEAFIKGWAPAEAEYEIEKVIKLTDKPIDAIIAANDGTASGAIKALQKYGIENVLVTGLDAELAACQRINEGSQTMTVYNQLKKLAYNAATLAYEIALKKKPDFNFVSRNNGRIDVPSLILESIAIDKSNLDILIEDGRHTREEIFSNN